MRFIIVLILLLGHVANCLGVQCTADDLGASVPARVCDPANCIPVTKEQLDVIGTLFYRPYEWNKGVKPFVGYCTNQYIFNVTKANDYNSNKRNVVLTYIASKGPNCSSVITGVLPFTAEEDPINKTITVFDLDYGGSKFQGCIALYDESTQARVFRLCRVDPPPPANGGYGCFYAELTDASPDPPQAILNYININLDIDWGQTVIECTI